MLATVQNTKLLISLKENNQGVIVQYKMIQDSKSCH